MAYIAPMSLEESGRVMCATLHSCTHIWLNVLCCKLCQQWRFYGGTGGHDP